MNKKGILLGLLRYPHYNNGTGLTGGALDGNIMKFMVLVYSMIYFDNSYKHLGFMLDQLA